MIPGPPKILICPHCKGEKEVMSLVSGNTFGSKQWSDLKTESPMLPRLSFVQQCPHCGKYFLLSKAASKECRDNDKYSFDTGTLNFQQAVDALKQLQEEGLSKADESAVRWIIVHSFNDQFRRNGDINEFDDASKELFKDNILKLLPLLSGKDLYIIKGELYREIGDFETAKLLLTEGAAFTMNPLHEKTTSAKTKPEEQSYIDGVVKNILKHVEDNDNKVFLLN